MLGVFAVCVAVCWGVWCCVVVRCDSCFSSGFALVCPVLFWFGLIGCGVSWCILCCCGLLRVVVFVVVCCVLFCVGMLCAGLFCGVVL